jgi:hypothetical protein
MKGSFRDNLNVPNRRRLFKHVRERRPKIRNVPRGARKPKPSGEVEEFAKDEVTKIITEKPEFVMPGEDTKIPQLKPRYFQGNLDNHFEKFVEVVCILSINMPLLDALQVPTYSCYFNDILANKYEIATLGVDHVKMSEQCSVAIANGLEKQKDPGRPTIPCFVGSFKFEKALCDLGAIVSVMPRDVFEKLCLPLEPTSMCLELGDNSIRCPLGIAEDVPVKVGHHFIPVDFVVLEMGEREKPPLILGRPFLKTMGATIDVGKGEIKIDINGERSSFKFRPRLEVCNMIEVKYVPPHCCIVKEEPRKKEELKKKEEPKKKDMKKIKEVVASVKTKEQKPPVKTKKMIKSENKPWPRWCGSGYPRLQRPQLCRGTGHPTSGFYCHGSIFSCLPLAVHILQL